MCLLKSKGKKKMYLYLYQAYHQQKNIFACESSSCYSCITSCILYTVKKAILFDMSKLRILKEKHHAGEPVKIIGWQ